MKIIRTIFVGIALLLVAPSFAEANFWTANAGSGSAAWSTYPNKTTYAPGEAIRMYGSLLWNAPGGASYTLTASIPGCCSATIISGNISTGQQQGTLFGTIPISFSAPSTPGSYQINVSGTAGIAGTTTGYDTITVVAASCTKPWGGALASGSSVIAYSTASVPFGSTCASQTRTCNNGILSGTYTNQSCTVAAAATCALPWGGTLASGGAVTAYSTASVPFGSACVSQSRTCTNGTLSGTYANQSCTVAAAASCPLPWGGTLASGSSVPAYLSPSVTSPSTCTSQSRLCTNGSLSGTYTNQSCTVTAPAGCTYAGPLSWGAGCSANSTWNAASGGTATISNTAAGYAGSEVYSCSNGVWGGPTSVICSAIGTVSVSSNIPSSWTITGPATITGSGTSQTSTSKPAGTYTITWGAVSGYTTPPSQSLTLTAGGSIPFSGSYSAFASCPLPWGGTLASGSSVPAYLSPSVTSPSTCTSQSRLCTNGSLSGTYTNQSCTVITPSCANGATNPTACTQCPSNQAYYLSTCVNCTNGGCTGGGGSASNPTGTLTCTNGATNPLFCNSCPASQTLVGSSCVNNCTNGATNPSACTACTAPQTLVAGVCTSPATTCGNGTCEAGETFALCPVDCPMTVQAF